MHIHSPPCKSKSQIAYRSPSFAFKGADASFRQLGPCPPPAMTDRAWAIGNLRKFGAPSAKFPQIANLQWSVCLHVAPSGNPFRGLFCSMGMGGPAQSRTPHVPPPTRGGMPGLRKFDIQSWVFIRSFSINFGPRNGWEMAIRPTKKLIFSTF